MGKRAAVAVSPPAKVAKSRKQVRAASPCKAVESKSPGEEVAADLYAPLAALFSRDTGGSDGTADMLCAALPFAVAGPKEERHPNQLVIIDSINEALARAEQERQTALDAVDSEIVQHARSRETTASEIEAAKNQAAARKDAKETKAEAEKNALKAVSRINAEIEDLGRRLAAQNAEIDQVQAEKAAYEQIIADEWTKLKATHQSKRERNGLAKPVMKMLGKASLPASLGAGLDIVLKMNPEERGSFATTALEHGEKLFAAHLALLSTRIANSGSTKEGINEGLEVATNQLQDATEQMTKADNELIDADNAWADAETQLYEIVEVLKRGEPRARELDAERTEKEESLSSLQRLKKLLEDVVDPSAAAVADVVVADETPEESPAAEEPAPQ